MVSEGANIGGPQSGRLRDLQSLFSMVVIHNSHASVRDLAAKGIAKDDELYQRQSHGHQHQGGGAKELSHLPFDNGPHAVHGCIPGRGGMMKLTDFTCSSPAGDRCSRRYVVERMFWTLRPRMGSLAEVAISTSLRGGEAKPLAS